MRRRVFTFATIALGIATAVLVFTSPTSSYASELWRWVLLVAAFAILAVGVPVWLNLRADQRPFPWARLRRFLIQEAPVESAMIMTIASAVFIAGTLGAGLSGFAVAGFAIAVAAAIIAATVENVFPYMTPGHEGPTRQL